MVHNNVLGHKRKHNAVAGVGGFNFLVVYKSVTAKAQKAEIELAVYLCWSSTWNSKKALKKQHEIARFLLQI